MSTNDYITIDMAISFEDLGALAAFIEALTGNDDDICLLAELAMNKRLGVDSYTDGVQVHPPAEADLRQILDEAIAAKERKKTLALRRLEIDAQISELQTRRARLEEEYA